MFENDDTHSPNLKALYTVFYNMVQLNTLKNIQGFDSMNKKYLQFHIESLIDEKYHNFSQLPQEYNTFLDKLENTN
jgi:hypothetical protein